MTKIATVICFGIVLAAVSATGGAQEPGGRAELDAAYGKAVALHNQGKHAEALPFLEKAAALAVKVHGPDHLETANVLFALANTYRRAGRPREAEPHYRRGLEIREARLGKDHLEVAMSLNNLAGLYGELARYQEAEAAFRRCLQIYEAKLPGNHRDLALPLENFAVMLSNRARYEEAEALFKRSLQIRAATKEGNDVGAAGTANSLGVLYLRQNRFVEAEAFLRRGLTIYQAKQGPDSLDVANSLNSLALLSKKLGNYQEAETLCKRSLAIKESKLGKDHAAVALSLNNLAALWREMGRYREAEELFRRSLQITEARLGKDSLDAAVVLSNLGGLYQEMGRLREAKDLLQRGLEIRETKLSKNHPAIANELNNLGMLFRRLGQPDKAEAFLRRSLQITEARSGKNSLELCFPLNNLARVFQASNRDKEADLLYRRSVQITETHLGKDHPNLITFLNNLSVASWNLKRFQEAEDFTRRSLQIEEARLDNNHPHRATTLERLAWIEHARKTGEPLKLQVQALEIHRTHLHDTFAFGSESAMLNHLDNIKGALPSMIDLALHSDSPGPAATLAYDWTLRLKGTALDTLCRYRQAQHLVAPDDALAQRVARYRTLKQLQANAALTPPTGLKPEQIKEQLAKWRAETEEVEVELNRAFARKYPNLAGAGAALTAAAVQQRLPADAALIEFARVLVVDFKTLRWNGYHYRAFVLTPGQAPPQLIDLGPAKAIDDGVRAVRQHIIDFQEKLRECESPEEARILEKNQEKQFHKVSADLHARLLAPLGKAIGAAKLLYVAADGELNRLPFEALMDGDGKYLVESVRCAYLSSGRDLLRKPADAAKGTVVFAGPDFKADAEERSAQAEKLLGKPTTLAARGSSAPQLRSKGWGALPGAAAEAKDIHGLLHDSPFGPVNTYTGAAALEEVLKAMPAPRVLHLATHGFFLDQEPAPVDPDGVDAGVGAGWARGRLKQADNPLLRSGIVLAGANTIGEQDAANAVDDGWVTAEEIALLNLQGTELVVLSACQTGLGDIKTGEGVYGLRRAFLYAGARTLVTSLFEVPDTETRDLMKRFYSGLKKGDGKLAALHAAQMEMLRRRRAMQGAAHPFFWASFVLIGDPS